MNEAAFAQLVQSALVWADSDPDPETAQQLREWIASSNRRAIGECFEPPLEFGTAGLRGIVGPGPARMNLAVVRRVTRALAEYLEHRHGSGSKVVVGCDARLDSARFSRETSAVFAAAGCTVLVFDGPVATPIVAFATLEEHAAAGVVVTASHNPPEYNGYKVYGENAIQIVSPVDSQVAERMQRLPPARDIPVGFAESDMKVNYKTLGSDCLLRYCQSVLQSRPSFIRFPLRIAYTPLHGVGWRPIRDLFQMAGYDDLQPVPSQVKPDGRFPTVQFPNPEEPGTLKLGIRMAEDIRAQLLLANDPDADRLAMALPDENGQWHALSGNQLGIILMDYLLDRARLASAERCPLVVSTVVSTPMADAVAASHGARIERTLTGFKWLWTAALEVLSDPSLEFALAWEEAFGYSTHPGVRDKDGIAAALVAADWAAACHASGTLPWNKLALLYRKHGAWASRQVNVHKPGINGAKEISGAFERLGNSPPSDINGVGIANIQDYRARPEDRPPWRGYSALLAMHLADGSRVLVRPSGTEPKLKLYIDVPAEVAPNQVPFSVLQSAEQRADKLGQTLVGWLAC